ncbi:MAG: UDP-N-acetylglucosamine--N-acetylmuramyl-(pentapeptide) pyrophosphoryl-undecaprenol N-acetylglucosamine transferase [Acidobacteria bacterium]|nr:UDP-N-acetylglucosamine--N-acetylmuramyl-(pentapeptide) pyrophosphoryl-undecaprenol N-acetylglucosamine transferase [Acidobacteriota bacterium]
MNARDRGNLRILLTGGGTGGHVYPLLSILQIIRRHRAVAEVLFVGAKGKAEETIVPRTDIPLRFVRCAPLSSLQPWRMIPALWQIFCGTLQAMGILWRFRPGIVLAAGGYVSAPVTFAAFLLRPLLGCRLIIDEQNVVPGLMNKVASLFAEVVMVSFPETPSYIWNNRCVYTGYPVRPEFMAEIDQKTARRQLGLPQERRVVLVYGGSMGSRSINRLLMDVLPQLAGLDVPLTIIHSCGLSVHGYHAWEDTTARLQDGRLPEGTALQKADSGWRAVTPDDRIHYRLEPYLHGLADYLRAADLVVCRAGAGSLAELMAVGRAAIVIPKRKLPGDHQEHNAINLAENGGCEVVFEYEGVDGFDTVDVAEFSRLFRELLQAPERLATMAGRAYARFNRKFEPRIAGVVQHLLNGQGIEYESSLVEPKRLELQKQTDQLVRFLLGEPPDGLYRRFYRIKMDEYLRAAHWATVNKGIKLAGALQRVDKIKDLRRLFQSGNGFMRRNVMQALVHFNRYHPVMAELIMAGLGDSYFEVRAAALQVAAAYADSLRHDVPVRDAVIARCTRRREHFDVRITGVRTLPQFIDLPEYFRIVGPLRFARNVLLRKAVLEGIRAALSRQPMSDELKKEVRRFISEFLVTTSDFEPSFSIRQSYVDLYRHLSNGE